MILDNAKQQLPAAYEFRQVEEYEATISRLTESEAAEQQAEVLHRRAAMEQPEPVPTVRSVIKSFDDALDVDPVIRFHRKNLSLLIWLVLP